MHHPLRRLAALAALAFSACTCGGPPKPPAAGTTGGATAQRPELQLEPVPAAPQVQVPAEGLPGARGELAVVVSRPRGDVYGEVRPTITFSKPVRELGTVEHEQGTAPVASIEPKLEGEWRWLGSASVEFVPKGLVPYATHFKVTVPAGLKALDGTVMAQAHSFEFDTPKPSVQEVVPREGDRWLKPDQTFVLLFNQAVQDVTSKVTLKVAGKPVALKLLKEVNLAEERRAQEKGRRYGRESFEERGFQNRQTRYELQAASPLPLDAEVELTLAADLRAKEGPATLGREVTHHYRTYGALKLTGVTGCSKDSQRCPYGPLLVWTTNRVEPASLKDKVTLSPAAAIDWDRVEPGVWDGQPYFSLPGRYKAGTTYQVKVAAGVQDEFKQSAAAGLTGSVRLSDLDPDLQVGPDLALLEAGGDGALPIETVNLSTVDVTLMPLDPPGMAQVLGARKRPPMGGSVTSLPVTSTHNVPRWSPVPVRDRLFAGQKGGLFRALIGAPELPKRPASEVVGQITDLAVHAKLGAQSGLVWVTRLSDGKVVPNAALALYDRTGASRWTGQTDADGLARLPGLVTLIPGERAEEYGEAPFALISASAGGDTGVTLSTWSGGLYPGSFELRSAWETAQPTSLGLVFADRGIYRPGDEVFLKGLARYRSSGEIKTPGEGLPVQVTVTDSRGKELLKQTVKTSRYGGFSAKLTIPADAPLGGYDVSASAQLAGGSVTYGGSFRVEEYRAPQFQVDVSAEKSDVVAGDPLKANIVARYLFGGAMAGAKVRWTAARSTTSFAPPNNSGFTFGAQTWWWDDNAPSPSSDIASGGEGEADAQGNLVADVGKADAPGGKTYAVTVEAEVEDVNRQRLANRATITVHPAALYAGVRVAGDGFATAGKPVKLEAVAVDLTGARQAGQAVKVGLKRREWKSIRKKGVGGEWFTETEPVETPAGGCEIKTEATSGTCEVKPEQPGLYLIEASVTDAQGRTQTTRSSFYAVGSGWVSWQRNDTDRIDLVADKASYDIGDTAHILVKSPYPEADAVLTVEREGVVLARHVKLTGSATALEVPIDEALVPNAFVGLVITRGRVKGDQGAEGGADPGRPATRFGYTELKVEKKSKRLAVTVTPERSEYRPREKVKVEVKVADWKGAPAQAEVTVWAVDEGVLRLTNYQAPDPVDAMHPERGLSVRIAEPLTHLVQKQLYGEKGAAAGGGGGDDASGSGIRNRFKTTVLFAPEVVTDGSGVGHVEFELPDNLTTYRIMAVAMTDADRFGAGQGKLAVSKKLMALPALPRLARVGDSFEAGVVVHTKGAEVAEAQVTASAEGLKLEGPAQQTVATADGRAHEVRFRFSADKAGTATLRFAVQGGGERDAVEQKLPVQLPVALEAVATYGDTTDQRVEAVAPPGGIRPDVGGLDLTLSSTVLGGFDENMRQLVEYPYGCAEQLSSRLVPFIALREITSQFGQAWPTNAAAQKDAQAADDLFSRWGLKDSLGIYQTQDPDEVVRKTVRALTALQDQTGGFRYWPDASCSSDYVSAYATLALHRAKELGFGVDEGALSRAKAHLADVAAGKCTPCTYGCMAPGDETRAFALYTLARSGAPRPSSYGELYARRQKLPLFAQAMLADAMYVGKGDRAQAKTLFTELLNHAKETPREVHFEETDNRSYASVWSSDPRTTAIILQTLTDLAPDHPFVSKIGNYLTKVRQGNGQFRNTQEAAFALMALTEVVRTKEKEAPNFTAKVTLGPTEVAKQEFKGRSMSTASVHVGPDKLTGLGKTTPLTFAKEGPGVLYYGALLRYAPAELPTTALDRGLVVQRWFEPFAGGGQSTRFFAGDLVRVRVRVATNQERQYVAVDVPLPAGLEPVDTSLASTAKLKAHNEDEGPGPGYENESGEEEGEGLSPGESDEAPWAGGWWSPFVHTETRDDRVVMFADTLPPGVHVTSFVARATTPGEFVLKPAGASEMYTPEVFGRSEGGRFTVLPASQVAAK